MQLTGKASIRGALTAITTALLGTVAVQAADGDKLESSLLIYSETDRVQAAEAIVNYSRALAGGRMLTGRFTIDGLTGASPSGATPSSGIQSFTRPSGNGLYNAAPGEIPLDDTFKDTRFSFDGSFTQPLDRMTSLVFGAHVSSEHDYTSLGGNIGFSRDFNKRNTTLSLSTAFSHDIVSPEGGAPDPLGLMALSSGGDDDEGEDEFEFEEDDDGLEGGGSSENKNVFDVVFGLTQVLDRKTVFRVNYSFNHTSGYLNDPYKILSVVQGPTDPFPGEPVDYRYESRPDNRTKHAVFAQTRRFVGGHTVDLSYRYFWDNWGITSHTVDLFWRIPISGQHALRPHVRYYKQTEADFYRTYLVDGAPVPVNASADYRLAPFHALTLGMQYLFPVARGGHFSIGAEYYSQVGDLSPPQSMGPLSRYDLYPDMDALMVRVGYSYDF